MQHDAAAGDSQAAGRGELPQLLDLAL